LNLGEVGTNKTLCREAEIKSSVYAQWFCGFLFILLLHGLWEFANRMPPVWDMAYHQLMGWSFLAAFRNGQTVFQAGLLSDYYPPLQYYLEAGILSLFGCTQFLPLLSNLLGLGLLSFSSFRIAAVFLHPSTSVLAGWLVLILPMSAWMSRVSLLDIPLAGWVALSLLAVIRSRGFTNHRWTIIFGIGCALGMLTKWTWFLFLLTPVTIAFTTSPNRIRGFLNLLWAALIIAVLSGWWYLLNLGTLRSRFVVTAGQASWEQDPGLSSFWGWIYYLRCLSSYYLFLPLSILFVVAIYQVIRTRRNEPYGWFLLISLAGGLFLLTVLPTKDPRYALPAIVMVAILLVKPINRFPKIQKGVLVFVFIQFLFCSFQTPLGDVKLALFSLDNDTDFVSVSREWVLFENNYFGILGPARKEDWKYREILEAVISPDAHKGYRGDGKAGGDTGRKGRKRDRPSIMASTEVGPIRVGFVPDAPFFSGGTLELHAVRKGVPIRVRRLGNNPKDVDRFVDLDWIVGKTGSQGISVINRWNSDVYEQIRITGWPIAGTWSLPDESVAILWKNPH